nr:retrovirus-related Pol polyprotein from transposon TNT 1-94 [Tanacetum cinerariifolium]
MVSLYEIIIPVKPFFIVTAQVIYTLYTLPPQPLPYLPIIIPFGINALVTPVTLKSDAQSKLLHFCAFVKTQFNHKIKSFQCDHGGEFDNNSLHELFATNGIQFRFSSPRTSQQNGKSERMIRTINNIVRSLLSQARLPPEYWVEALLTATYLLNILPSTSINNDIPYTKLFNKATSYTHLRTFGCLCYPYTFPPHKLAPRITPSIFLGYPYNHRGYRYLDLNTNKIIISHDNLDTSLIVLCLLTTPTSPQQTPPQTKLQTTLQAIPQTTPPTLLPTPSPLNTTLLPNTSPPNTSPPPPSPSTSQHPMVTRYKVGIMKANPKYNFHVTISSPIPKSPFHALRDHNWKQAMCDEYKALINNKTWVLVPCPPNVNIVRSMWLYKHKYNADGSLSWYKARLVANGRSQQQGIDYDETFSPVVKHATIRTVLSLAVSRQWPIHQLDVNNAFLHGHLQRQFTCTSHQDVLIQLILIIFVFCKIRFMPLSKPLELSFSDFPAMLFEPASITAKLTPSSTSLLQRIISSLHAEFAMTDRGPLNYFLGISATTLIDINKKLGPEESPVTDPTLYRSLFGSLQYLIVTRLDLSYAVQQLCLYMHDPREPHLNVMKRVLRCLATCRSTSGYCVFLGDNLLTWSSKHQDTLSRSSAEAEYRGVANAIAETSWIRNLFRELHTLLSTATLVYCVNTKIQADPVPLEITLDLATRATAMPLSFPKEPRIIDSIDLSGDTRHITRLHIFCFSLHDQAINWLDHLLARSISTWDDPTTCFLTQFFLPGRTAKL